MHALHRAIFLLAASVAVAGCALPPATVPSGSVLFQDDFARRFQGWKAASTGAFDARQAEGVYRLSVTQPDSVAWATPGIAVGDVRIEVDASKVAGVDDDLFGVICRYVDARDFVFLLISSDGYAGIGMMAAGKMRMLSAEAMMPSAAIRTGTENNHLRAECIGDRAQLYVNGERVAGAKTSGRVQGDIGLMVGANAAGGVEVSFDNFSALQP